MTWSTIPTAQENSAIYSAEAIASFSEYAFSGLSFAGSYVPIINVDGWQTIPAAATGGWGTLNSNVVASWTVGGTGSSGSWSTVTSYRPAGWINVLTEGNMQANYIVNKTYEGTSDRCGATEFNLTRTGGLAGSGYFQNYMVNAPGASDCGITSLISGSQGGTVWSHWIVASGPTADTPHGTVGQEINVQELAKDYGLQRDIYAAVGLTIGTLYVPESDLNLGYGGQPGYNCSFGVVFCHQNQDKVRWWVPTLYQQNCTVPGGVQTVHCGGSTEPNAPLAAEEVRDYFHHGIDMREATFTDFENAALWFGTGHTLRWEDGTYFDPSGTTDSIANVNGTGRSDAPSYTGAPTAWINIKVNGTKYSLPLYS